MDKRYQAFVSSTFEDLKAERQAAIRALLGLGFMPTGMELFPAASSESWEYVTAVIDDCDYYLLIVGGRYGTVDEAGLSFTEREYNYALSTKKPVVAFFHEDPGSIAAANSERDPERQARLEVFKDRVRRDFLCKGWKSPEALEAAVAIAMSQVTKRTPAIGWVRADSPAPPELVQEVADLRGRVLELQVMLSEAEAKSVVVETVLARGAEEFEISYAFTTHNAKTYATTSWKGAESLSWDEILAAVGPTMIEEATELKILGALARAVEKKAADDKDFPRDPRRSFAVLPDDFHTVVVQLVGLDYVTPGTKKRTPSDRNTYWVLTPVGRRRVIALRGVAASANAIATAV